MITPRNDQERDALAAEDEIRHGDDYPRAWTHIGDVEGTLRYDDDGNPIVQMATCGGCGRSWNDALITGTTPTPAGRCPFEYEHGDE